jgi:uncharacterized protein YndB with AHSA1/START domain
MIANKQTTISKDAANKKLVVVREFDAPLEQVWNAWTQPELLDEWWAPRPWKAKTKTLDFKPGGYWLYAMQGPDGSESWCRADFKSVTPVESFSYTVVFCDEQGNIDNSFPSMHWKNDFTATATGTQVTVEVSFATEADLEKIVELGFKEGFTAAHGNLDELLAASLP